MVRVLAGHQLALDSINEGFFLDKSGISDIIIITDKPVIDHDLQESAAASHRNCGLMHMKSLPLWWLHAPAVLTMPGLGPSAAAGRSCSRVFITSV